MRTINITNEKKRDAQVCMEAIKKPSGVKRVLENGEDYFNIKILKHNLSLAFETLRQNYDDMIEMGNALMESDIEIDMEVIGKKITGTQKLYLNQNGKIAYRVNMVQVIKDPQGSEKERRDLARVMSNVTGESIVQWTGRKFPKSETIRKFVFVRKMQLRHISGLTFDFLYEMAKSLHEAKAFMFIGGGPKAMGRLLSPRGANPTGVFWKAGLMAKSISSSCI